MRYGHREGRVHARVERRVGATRTDGGGIPHTAGQLCMYMYVARVDQIAVREREEGGNLLI